jgi:hypothetical protein
MFYTNMNRNTRTGEQFTALMHRLHFLHYVYWGCPIALGHRTKAIGFQGYDLPGKRARAKRAIAAIGSKLGRSLRDP